MIFQKMKYSIIIPTHNNEKFIDRSINAILNSEFDKEFELIVVDDASQDDTANIAEKLGAKVIKNSKCSGPSKTRNVGARYAKGEILIFIDSDILLFSDTLQKIDNFFNNEKEFIAISCKFDPKCEMPDSISRYRHLYSCFSLMNHPKSVSWAFASTFAIKKDIFEYIGGFNEKVWIHEDDVIGRELISKKYKIALGNHILIKHLHKRTLSCFVRERILRSRARLVFRFTTFLKKIKLDNEPVSKNITYSILLFPFFIFGFFLGYLKVMFLIMFLIVFYLINFRFLYFCKKNFGLKFMLQSAFIIPLDCLCCGIGIVWGIFDFLVGRRI